MRYIEQIDKILEKYQEVHRHSCSVRDLALNFALYLGYSYEEAMKIQLGAYLHDIGKVFIDPEVLFKETRLTEEEFAHIKKHSSFGYDYLKEHNYELDEDLMAIVLQHHERVDGTGYPLGLKNDEIHPYAKIVSLCDVYDAITSQRCYKIAYSPQYALSEIEKGLGNQFDQELGKKFIEFMREPKRGRYPESLCYQTTCLM